MFHTHCDDRLDVFISQGIINDFPLPAGFDEPGLLQDPQLVGYRGLGGAECSGDVADAHFIVDQQRKDADAGGIAEVLEKNLKAYAILHDIVLHFYSFILFRNLMIM